MNTSEAQQEIKDCIEFYESRGWDWLDVVAFLAMEHTGRLERYLNPHRRKMPHEYRRPHGKKSVARQ